MKYEVTLSGGSGGIVKQKSFAFAVRVVRLCQYLQRERKEWVISGQLVRAGTSIGANVREAYNAESTPDFLHKLGVAQKECDESLYWLELLHATDYLSEKEFHSIQSDNTELLKIIRSIILTKKKGSKSNQGK